MKINKDKKTELFNRDGARCQCCSRKLTLYSMTLGHRIPKAIARSNELPNLQLECVACNGVKSRLNRKYIRKARRFKKNGGKLIVSVHSVTYNRLERENSLEWFEDNNFILEKDDNVMVGDFAVLGNRLKGD